MNGRRRQKRINVQASDEGQELSKPLQKGKREKKRGFVPAVREEFEIERGANGNVINHFTSS